MPTSTIKTPVVFKTLDGNTIDRLLADNIAITVEQIGDLLLNQTLEITVSEPSLMQMLGSMISHLSVIVNGIDFNPDKGSTTVHWDDDTSTTVRCAKGTEFDEYTAFTAALAKRLYGNNSAIRRMIHKKDSREIDRKQKEANLKAQAERERVAAKRRKERIKRMARKMKEEAEARKLAGIE